MAIVLRQNKGSALTFSELDNNFQELVDATNSLTTIVTNSAQNGQAGAGSGITLTIADFSTGQNASIDLARLSDDGQGGFTSSTSPVLASIDLSADNVATASGSGSLAYSSANKRYSYTPPSISDMLGSHTINLSTQGLSGTIPSARLPSISLTSVTTVANEAAVANLSSTTQEGDVVLQTTGTKSYVRNSGTAGDINDFTELLTPDSDTTYAISMEQTGGNDTDPTLNLTPNQGTADTVTIKGGGATAVSRTDSGESVTITSTNTTYDSKAVENGFSTVSPLVTDVTNDVVTTNGAHTINDGTIIRVSETNDDTGLTLGEYTVSSTNKAGGQFTLVGVGTETTLSGANFHILNNDNPKIQLIGSDGTNDHITLTGGSNTTVTRNNDTNITIDGIGDTSYDFNADKSSDVNLPSMSSVSSDVVTFSGNHGLSDGDLVRVENAGVSGINTGDFTVSSQNGSNQFTATGIGSATGSLFSVIMTQISNSNPDLRLVGSDSTTDRVQVRGTGQVTVTRSSNELITIASSPSGTSTAIQKGDGAGGFSDATAGADFLGTIGASSGIQKGNGNGALVDAVEGTDYNSPDKIGARFRLPSGNNSVTGTHKHIEIATINITAVGESYKASFLINTTDYADNTNITETTHISIRQTDAFGNNPEIYLSTETSRKTGDMGVFCKTRKTSVTSPANLTQVKLFAVLPATGNVGAEGFVTSETVSDSTNVSATWESSFAETDYLNVSQYGALGGNGDIGDIVFLHTTRSERWADLFGSTEGITVTDGNDNNPISVIGNGTGFLKNNGSGTYSYDNTTYSTLALGTTNTTALAGDTVVDNLLLEIPKSSNSLSIGDKSWLKVATVTIDARYEYYSAQLAVVGTGAAEGVANEKILAIRVKQQAQMGQAPAVDIDIYNNGNEDYDFGHVVAVNSGTETRVDIYFRPDGPNSGAEVYKMADTVTATVAWSSTGNAYATSAPANFVQGGAHQQWHSGNQAGIFGNLDGVLQADGNGVLSVATLPPDLTVDGAGTVHANNYTDTNTTYAISCVDGDAITEEKIRLTAGGSGSGTDDVVLAVGTGLSIARTNDKITFANTLSQGDTNQNAFSNVAVNGQTTVAADSATDTLTLVAGSNITLATDANADSVTINTTALAGDTTFSTLANSSTATDTITIGASAQTGAITIGNSTAAQTINIAGGSTAGSTTNTVNIASTGGTGSTKTVNIARMSATGVTTNILMGNTSSSATSNITLTGNTTINNALGSNTITIGGTTQTGTITLGRSTKDNTINIGNAATESDQEQIINIGSGTGSGLATVNIAAKTSQGNDTAVTIGGNDPSTGTCTVAINGATTFASGDINFNGYDFNVTPYTAAKTITLGSTNGTGTITLGRSTQTQMINIGTGTVASSKTKTINIGTGNGSGSTTNINIGPTNSSATRAININGPVTVDGTVQFDHMLSLYSDAASGVYDQLVSIQAKSTSTAWSEAARIATLGSGSAPSRMIIGQDNAAMTFFDGFGSRYIYPAHADTGAGTNGVCDLGSYSARWKLGRFSSGVTTSSDRNEKRDIEELTAAELRVAVRCKPLLRKYRRIDAYEEKGEAARIHFGIIAQDLDDAFTAEGLDAHRYAMFMEDTWYEYEGGVVSYPTLEDIPEEHRASATEHTAQGVRYEQLLAFMIAAL